MYRNNKLTASAVSTAVLLQKVKPALEWEENHLSLINYTMDLIFIIIIMLQTLVSNIYGIKAAAQSYSNYNDPDASLTLI